VAQVQNAPGVGNMWMDEARATFKLAWPLVLAQLAQIGLSTSDVIMMGWLGPEFLGAGALAHSFMFFFLIFGMGLVTAVAPMMAKAIGEEDEVSVRRTVRQGFWVCIAFSTIVIPFMLQIDHIFLLLGQAPDIAVLAETYARVGAFQFYPFLLFAVMRSFLAAHNITMIVLLATLVGIVLNIIGNYGLMFGNFGLPRLELLGAGISTVIVHSATFLFALFYALALKRFKDYNLLQRFWKPDWQRFFEVIRVGVPIGFMLMAEIGMFSVAAFMMGWLSKPELAAHAIALQITAISFMVPLGISQATTVRVGICHGRRSPIGVMVAGWTNIAMGVGFMVFTCILYILFPGFFVQFFLNPADPENVAAFNFAVTYIMIAGVFQLVDGGQVMAAASLRGLSDTKVPMAIALFGYWVVGIPVGYLLGFVFEWRGIGVWAGMALGLAVVAVLLTIRFSQRDRLGLVRYG
jgi:MATE family multidrug resistance protein